MSAFTNPLTYLSDLWGSLWGDDEAANPAPAPTEIAPPAAGAAGGQQPTAAGAAPVVSHWAEPSPPPDPSVVYLGINDASREKERQAFKGQKNATLITGAGTDPAMQGKTLAQDGKTVLDLGNEADLRRYMTEVGVGAVRQGADGQAIETPEQAAARMQSLENLFLGERGEDGQRAGGMMPGVRDEMAGFLQVLQKVERGEMAMDRVVMSGHSTGEWVYSEDADSSGVTFEQMASLMGQFPQAQAGVKDFMLSACHTLENGERMDNRDGKQYQDIFPNLETVWGYNGYSPSYKQGSVGHIQSWLRASEGDNPSAVARAARAAGQNATVKAY